MAINPTERARNAHSARKPPMPSLGQTTCLRTVTGNFNPTEVLPRRAVHDHDEEAHLSVRVRASITSIKLFQPEPPRHLWQAPVSLREINPVYAMATTPTLIFKRADQTRIFETIILIHKKTNSLLNLAPSSWRTGARSCPFSTPFSPKLESRCAIPRRLGTQERTVAPSQIPRALLETIVPAELLAQAAISGRMQLSGRNEGIRIVLHARHNRAVG
jgi:hypothetical protein